MPPSRPTTPPDPADASNPKVKEFLAKGAAGGLSEGQLNGGISSAGWGFAGAVRQRV